MCTKAKMLEFYSNVEAVTISLLDMIQLTCARIRKEESYGDDGLEASVGRKDDDDHSKKYR